MRCPSCDMLLDSPTLERCPRCGYMLAPPTVSYPVGGSPYGAPQSAETNPVAGHAVPPTPANPNDPYGTGAANPPVTPPVTPPTEAPPRGYVPVTGAPAPNADPAAPRPDVYGQPTVLPTVPVYPPPVYPAGGYQQPAYLQQTGSPLPVYPSQAYIPQQFATTDPGHTPYPGTRPRKRRAGRVIGLVALVVVVLVACAGGTVLAVRALGPQLSALSKSRATSTATTTATSGGPGSLILASPFASDAKGWPVITGGCFFGSGGYHTAAGYACYAPAGTVTNFDATVTVRQLNGAVTSPYGFLFRREGPGNSYQFDVTATGKWAFFVCKDRKCRKLIDWTSSTLLHTGLNMANTLEVVAKGSHFALFINETQVGSYDDTTHPSGEVGFGESKDSECILTNFILKRPA
jgi:hypothetical protein